MCSAPKHNFCVFYISTLFQLQVFTFCSIDWFRFQKPLAIDPFRIPRCQDFWDKIGDGSLDFNLNYIISSKHVQSINFIPICKTWNSTVLHSPLEHWSRCLRPGHLHVVNPQWFFHKFSNIFLSLCVTELLKRTDTRTHVSATFSRICAKFQLAKQELFHIFGTIWLGFFQILQVL